MAQDNTRYRLALPCWANRYKQWHLCNNVLRLCNSL